MVANAAWTTRSTSVSSGRFLRFVLALIGRVSPAPKGLSICSLDIVRTTNYMDGVTNQACRRVTVHAALVTSFDAPPRYVECPDPVCRDKDEVVVEVLAAALHPRVRSQANG